MHVPSDARQSACEHPKAGTYLEDDVPGTALELSEDHAQDVVVDEEVLT